MISAELTRSRIEDLHRDAQRSQLVRDASRGRRQQYCSGTRTASGHPASVLTSYALAPPGVRPITVRPHGFLNNARVIQLKRSALSKCRPAGSRPICRGHARLSARNSCPAAIRIGANEPAVLDAAPAADAACNSESSTTTTDTAKGS